MFYFVNFRETWTWNFHHRDTLFQLFNVREPYVGRPCLHPSSVPDEEKYQELNTFFLPSFTLGPRLEPTQKWAIYFIPQVIIVCTTAAIFGSSLWYYLHTEERTSLVYAPTVVFASMSSLLTMVTPTLHQELTGNEKVETQLWPFKFNVSLTES